MSYTSGNVIFVPSLRAMVIGSGFSAMSSRSATEMMFLGLSPAMMLPAFRVLEGRLLGVGLGLGLVGLLHSRGAGLLLGVALRVQFDGLGGVGGLGGVAVLHETGHDCLLGRRVRGRV